MVLCSDQIPYLICNHSCFDYHNPSPKVYDLILLTAKCMIGFV